MATYTTNLNLKKPAITEQYDVDVFNDNADKIDGNVIVQLKTTETITVGTGGQYATINQALAYATKKYPTYVSASTRPIITISLLSGFVMAEQVIVDGLDLSWITISSVDAEVSITRSSLTIQPSTLTGSKPAFMSLNGGFLPIINTLFNMDTSGDGTNRHGIVAFNNSRAIINSQKGFKNVGGVGIYAYQGSTINANGAIASGASSYGIYAEQSSTINASSANASYAGTYGVYATNASTIEFSSGNAQRAGYNTSDVLINANADGIYANRASTINAVSANASYSGRYGVYALVNSRVNFISGIATNTGSYSVNATGNSIIYAGSSNCSTDGSPAEEYRCSLNSFIDINGAAGEVNTTPTLNSYTYAGLITNGSGVITTSGSLPLTGGTLTGLLTTNGQIQFPATQNPSADANTLDDYEEGTFTPYIFGTTTAGTGTYSFQEGHYTKIGNVVNFRIKVQVDSHNGTGNLLCGGLPFLNAQFDATPISVYARYLPMPSGTTTPLAYVASTGAINLTAYTGTDRTFVQMDTNFYVWYSGSFIVS